VHRYTLRKHERNHPQGTFFAVVTVLRLSKYSKKQVKIENIMDLTHKLPGEKDPFFTMGHQEYVYVHGFFLNTESDNQELPNEIYWIKHDWKVMPTSCMVS
jgi:hypothetical protein